MDQFNIVLATNNPGKLKEVQALLQKEFTILSLADIGLEVNIPEDFETLEENALQKAKYIHDKTGMNVLADDTGLEVQALEGRPGVYSARYAGPNSNSEKNIDKLLRELGNKENRKAQFRTVMALVLHGQEHVFEGICEGQILKARSGSEGFGYDPVFCPKGYKTSFAQMSMSEKNKISHRALALKQVIDFLT